jgi:superkiller protein 3
MSVKAALKAAKVAIGAKKWDEAITQAELVLEADPKNYFAKVFLGRALEQIGKPDEAAKAYEDATKIQPAEANAWLGLRNVYEGQGSAKVDKYISVGLKLAEIYAEADDAHKSQTAIDKLVDFARKNGTKLQYAKALETQLPTSPVYSFLEGRLPHPSILYTRLAEIHEAAEKERINKEIGERRSRLGATLTGVTTDVKREVYGKSQLESIYQNIIDWTTDDELRRQYEEKLLVRAYDTLMVLPKGKKAEKRDQVMKLAHDMVIIRHPFLLAWQIDLEWRMVN